MMKKISLSSSDISIVIPCYNGWKYMERCLESLERQTISPFEVVIVDDCSTDDSYEKIKEYSKQSNLNMVVRRNSRNMGPSLTRRNAINIAKGDYISFCDCDDWYEKTFVEDITDAVGKSEASLLIFDNYVVSSKAKYIDGITSILRGKDKEGILALYKMSLCRCVVEKSLFDGVEYPKIFHGEDGALIIQLILKARKIEILNKPLYNYYNRIDSASNTPDTAVFYEMQEAFEAIKKNMNGVYYSAEVFLGLKYICYAATLNGLKAGINRSEILECVNKFNSLYPDWYDNKYIRYMDKSKRIYLTFIRYKFISACGVLARIHDYITKHR